MAAFTKEESLQHALDYQLLQNAPISIYRNASILERDLAKLQELGYRILRIDLARCGSGNRFWDTLIETLELSSWWGRNDNTLREAFEDLQVPSPGGLALIFENAHRYPASELNILIQNLADASRHHALHAQRFIPIIQSDHKLRQIDITTTAALLNPTESWGSQ